MSSNYQLSVEELTELRFERRHAREKYDADRLKAVILLASGWSARDIAEALLIDEDTVRSYFKRYRKGGVEKLLRREYLGSEGWLSEEQLAELDEHLQQTLCLSAKEVRAVQCYSPS